MYRILKEKGNNQNITLENKDTKVSIIMGKLSTRIMSILETEIEFDESRIGAVKLTDKWDFDISDGAGKVLASTAMEISKPIKSQARIKSEQVLNKTKTKSGKEAVDVFDLIFGTN